MKLIIMLPSLCLTLLTSHADEAATKATTLDPATTLKVNKEAELAPSPFFKIAKDQPFWILHSYQADLLM